MSKLVWDATGEHLYETGVRNGMLYLVNAQGAYSTGVAWNGLTAITESPSGAEANDLYADDIKYLTLRSAETFGGTIEAYTYPDEFGECDGSVSLTDGMTIGQQPRKVFGLAYRTVVGNDTELDSHGYKLHLIYGCTASPSEKAYQSINDSPEAITFSWEFSTVPVNVANHQPTASVVIDSTKFTTTEAKDKLTALEDVLFGKDPTTEGGSDGIAAHLPLPDQIVYILTHGSEQS